MSIDKEVVLAQASGKWPSILAEVGGISPDFLVVSKTKEGPCPCCAGNTRYRFDDRHGNGDWFCSHCGGKDRQGGGGTGFDLLMRMQDWTFSEALRAVAQHLGVADDWKPPTTPPTAGWDRVWRYSDEFYVLRRDFINDKGEPDKEIRPLSWNGRTWVRKRPEGELLPLYNRDGLRQRPEVPVLVVEGEKAADAAIELLSDLLVVTTWHGGTKGTGKVDWTPLRGRRLYLWPDADHDGGGRRAMEKVAAAAKAAGVWMVDPPEGMPNGWDLADALADGWTADKALAWLDSHSQRFEVTTTTAEAAATDSSEPGPADAGEATLTFEDRWAALEAHADELARSDWPQMKALASLAIRASELEITRLTERRLEQLLEAAQRRIRPASEPIAPGGVFTISPTPWAVKGVFRHGLNLLVGQSGAGKSRLSADCMAAWLRGEDSWLGRELQGPPVEERHALIVGTDQPLEDWVLTLQPVGLCIRTSGTEVQLHRRVTLYPLESALTLDVDGLAVIRRWIDAHPGGMVLVDSLAACLPPGIDEDKAGAARPVHALQEAIGNGWGILTHHSRKSAGKEGNLGVGAGRGSSAIDAAVSRVVGLGLIHKLEHGVMTPQESDPRRELLSTKRGGATVHLVITSDEAGRWAAVGEAADLKRQEQQDRIRQGLTDKQADVLTALEDVPGVWLTAKQVIEALGDEWVDGKGPKGPKAAQCRKLLKRLEVAGLVESVMAGSERTYRAVVTPPEVESYG